MTASQRDLTACLSTPTPSNYRRRGTKLLGTEMKV